uniref:C2 domain-containing protein n=1 Tax=Acrobeloides nanus TaxID=290746 RepID=A0A914BYN2_9BILA
MHAQMLHRRLSLISDTIVKKASISGPPERKFSQHEQDCAMHFLHRRKSSDSTVVFGSIQPDLYRRRGSIINVRSVKEKTRIGRIQLKLSYDFSKSDLMVSLLEVSIKAPVEECQFVFSLDPTQRKESCRIIPGRIFHKECFKFPITYDELMEKTLSVELTSIRNNGSSIMRYGKADLTLSTFRPADEVLIWVDLEFINDVASSGELNLRLQYLSSAHRLSLMIHQATNITRPEGLPNTYVRAVLSRREKILKKRKTSKKSSTCSPVWNEVLTFNADPKSISSCQLEIRVVDCDRFGNKRTLGRVVFGDESSPNSVNKLWRDSIDGRETLPQWVSLIPIAIDASKK